MHLELHSIIKFCDLHLRSIKATRIVLTLCVDKSIPRAN